MNDRKLDKSIIGLLILTLIACPIIYYNEQQFTLFLREILESPLLKYIIWVLIFLLYIIHYWKFRRTEHSRNNIVLSTALPPFMDNLFGAVTYGVIITSTLTLMKGLYIQLAFGETHFKDFSEFDIFSLAIALFFLLWYSLTRIAEDIQEIFWIEHTGKVELNPPRDTPKERTELKEE